MEMQFAQRGALAGEAAALTLAPLGVQSDDLVDETDVRVPPFLRLAHEVRVAALVGAEEDHVEHFFLYMPWCSPSGRRKAQATVCGHGEVWPTRPGRDAGRRRRAP